LKVMDLQSKRDWKKKMSLTGDLGELERGGQGKGDAEERNGEKCLGGGVMKRLQKRYGRVQLS